MRRLFAALPRIASTGNFGIDGNVLRKNPNNGAPENGLFVKNARGRLFDRLPQMEKLRRPCATLRPLHPSEVIESGIANLAHDNFVAVQHGKSERSPLPVVTLDFVTGERHGQYSTQTDTTDRRRLPQPIKRINNLTAALFRKLVLAAPQGADGPRS
jgi:hypothetical protein